MNKKNTKKLFDEFDFFKPNRSITEGLMAFGFECGDGWYKLIYKLCKDIQKELDKNPKLKHHFEVLQVKEKFGGLRFYYQGGNDKIYKLSSLAEQKSYQICDECGESGKTTNEGWYVTLCDKHREEYKKRRDLI